MRFVVAMLGVLWSFTAMAENITMPLADVEHAIDFLKNGGRHIEGFDLAAKMTAEAQAEIDKLNAANKKKYEDDVAAKVQAGIEASQKEKDKPE